MKFVMRSGNVGTTVTGVAMSISELVETEFNLWRVKALEASNPDLTLTTFQQRLVRYPTRKMRWLNGLNYKLRQITKVLLNCLILKFASSKRVYPFCFYKETFLFFHNSIFNFLFF